MGYALDETVIGGPARTFPPTRWDALPEEENRLGRLLGIYWKPVYWWIRCRWRRNNEEAKDLTQGFFARLIQDGSLERVVSERGGLRAYLRSTLHHYLVDHTRRENAVKRGGLLVRLPLDEQEISGDEAYDRGWIAATVGEALRRLKRSLTTEGRETHLRVFLHYYVDRSPDDPRPSYAEVAERWGLLPHDVCNSLVYVRRRLRVILMECVRETVGSDPEAEAELRFVLGG